MKHLMNTSALVAMAAFAGTAQIERKGEEGAEDDIVTKALEDLTKTVDDRIKEVEKKADTTDLLARLDKLEVKTNRPGGGSETKDEPSAERKAFAVYLAQGDHIEAEDKKALNVSNDKQGGFLAPPEMSSEVIRDLVEFSPIRQFASVRGTSADSVIYPTRGDITNATWVGEMQPSDESTITFGQREIQVHELSTFVDISNRLLQDAPQAETEVRMALAEDFGKKEATAFLYGVGVDMPQGLMVDPRVPEMANGSTTELSTDALIALMYSMPAAYRNRGAWGLNGTTLGKLRTLKDSDGKYIWQPSVQVGQPETLLGRPVVEMVDLDDAEANSSPIIYGDFQAYRIVDRLSMSVLVDPYTLARQRITRIHATRRVGGALLQPARFRKLKMAV
jgi:HK97 family phage major capsid protein